MKHYKPVEFCKFLVNQAPLHKRTPIEDFLATVLGTPRGTFTPGCELLI